MKKWIVVSTVVSLAALFAAFVKADEEKEKKQAQSTAQRITLRVEGVDCADCARVLTAAMGETDLNIVGRLRPNPRGPSQAIATCPAECDLGACAAKVNGAETPHREDHAPGLCLVLFGTLDGESQQHVQSAMSKLRGVDAEACACDTRTGQIQIKLTGMEKVTASQIAAALNDAGIAAQLMRPRRQLRREN